MSPECFTKQIEFQGLGQRKVVADFSAGPVTSDAGSLLLAEVDKKRGILQSFSNCFTDHRDQRYVEHPLKNLLAQRVYGICLGYEDLNDHEVLRKDPLLAPLWLERQTPWDWIVQKSQTRERPWQGKAH